MMKSIFTKYAIHAFIFVLLVASAFLFLTSTQFQPTTLQTKPVTAELKTTALSIDQPEPVIQIASLSKGMSDAPESFMEGTYNSQADIKERLVEATRLAQTENFNEAMKILNSIPETEETHYAVNFLKARILAWSGKHFKAEESFRHLNKIYPENSDILVSQGYLKLYQRNYAQAEEIFTRVLKKNPNYHDAKNGLNVALSAQKQ